MSIWLKVSFVVLAAAVIQIGSVHDWSAAQMLASGGAPVPVANLCDVQLKVRKCEDALAVCNTFEDDSVKDPTKDYLYESEPTSEVCSNDLDCKPLVIANPKLGCKKVFNAK